MARQANKITTIKQCRSCGSKKLVNILYLGNQYLSDFIENDSRPPKFPLTLVRCNKCSLIQLKHTVGQKFLYTERYGYKSGINKTMQGELREIVTKAFKKIPRSKNSLVVVDIGANDGTLLSNYPLSVFRIGIEPIRKFTNECKKHANVVVNDFFSYNSYSKILKNKKAHIITAISCFYDMEDPNKFLSDINKILDNDGIFVIQQNYLVEMLRQNAFDNIVHEHLEYYSLLSLENLLSKHNLEVFDVELSDVNGGSFRTYIARRGKKMIEQPVLKMQKKESNLKLNQKRIYEQFAKRVIKNKEKLRMLVDKLTRKSKTIYIYGASTRGNTLLQYYKLNNKMIKKAVERYPEKWGKKIASVGIPIVSEEEARRNKPDYMLVLPWFFKKEFLKRENKYLKNGGHLIFPLPKIEIV